VLDSPYSSAVDVAAVHYGMLPVRWLMFDQFRSDLAIRDVRIPVLIVHGDDDRVIPMNLVRRLFERANEPKESISVAGGGHLVLGLTEVFVRVREWIDTDRDEAPLWHCSRVSARFSERPEAFAA
jgi:hypothetical protein